MVLMNVDDLDGVVREAARVLDPDGRFWDPNGGILGSLLCSLTNQPTTTVGASP
jgi:ubiquinone/menaquinone biosynthesis C-methylase UbiE